MAEDIPLPKGSTRRSKPLGNGANPIMVPLFGIVKDNIDATRTGKIRVYLADNSGLNPDDGKNWRTVSLLTPFYGHTRSDSASDDWGKFKTNSASYGMWMSPPDIGTTVLCLFVGGDINYGFYIGCVPTPEALQMVPAIGAVDNIVANEGQAESYGGATRLPVTNINSNNKAIADTTDYLTAAKPVHSYTAAVMFNQGILRDPIRGPISSSAQRETPSRVGWGVSTPGRPIYEGGYDDATLPENLKSKNEKNLKIISRRGGHSIVMDDGDLIGQDNLVRIRTAQGHQILMSDDGQTLMILHSNGQSYVELGKEGTVDVYSTNSINLRTQGDLNLHADNNINIHATKKLNMYAENIGVEAAKTHTQLVGADKITQVKGTHTIKVGSAMSMESAGDISMASSAIAFVNGSKVNLNSGQTSTKPQDVQELEKVLHTDTLFDRQKGYLAAPAKLKSIASRAPAHAPWANAGQGVDVKTNLDSESNLPATPSPEVAATNATAAASSVASPVAGATVAAAPRVSAASSAINQNTTVAVTAQVATNTVNGSLANAAIKGTVIDSSSEGVEVAVGKFALTPEQLEKANYLKLGAAAIIKSVAASTGNIEAAMTDNLFTGKNGITNLADLTQNVNIQTQILSQNLKIAQDKLQAAGIITGKEAGSQIAGLIMSASENGVDQVIAAVKQTKGPDNV